MTAALDAIRALAEAATPGPWEQLSRVGRYTEMPEREMVAIGQPSAPHGPDLTRAVALAGGANAAYIAAVDPQTVLALIAALDRAEAVVVVARAVDAAAFAGRGEGVLIADINRLRAALRAYEDADKVADG